MQANQVIGSDENQTIYKITAVYNDNLTVYLGNVLLPPTTPNREPVDTFYEVMILAWEENNPMTVAQVLEGENYHPGENDIIEQIRNDGIVYTVLFYNEHLFATIFDYQTLVHHGEIVERLVYNAYGPLEHRNCLVSDYGTIEYIFTHVICQLEDGLVFGASMIYPELNTLNSGVSVKVVILHKPHTQNWLSQEQIIGLMDSIGYRRYISLRFEQIRTPSGLYVVMPYIFGGDRVPPPAPVVHHGVVDHLIVRNEMGDAFKSECLVSPATGRVYELVRVISNGPLTCVKIGGVLEQQRDAYTNEITYIRPNNITQVVVKQTPTALIHHPLENVSSEISMMQAFEQLGGHPHLSRIIECIETNNITFLVIHFARGGDMFNRIGLPILARPTENTLRMYFRQILEATQYLNSLSLTHRDISAENILLDIQDGTQCILCDFGQTIRMRRSQNFDTHLDLTWELFGKPKYRPPEIYCRHGPYDAYKCDVWQLGILLFYMATRRFPLNMETCNPRERYTFISNEAVRLLALYYEFDVSVELLDIIERMLRIDPLQRPSIAELLMHPWLAMN